MPHWNSIELYTTCEVLREYGWSQNRWRSDDGFCLMEGLYESYARLETDEPRRHAVNSVLQRLVKSRSPGSGIISWNDSISRSFADVVSMLREADSEL